jgi:hypothetical protein
MRYEWLSTNENVAHEEVLLYKCNGVKKILENTYLKLDANGKVK